MLRVNRPEMILFALLIGCSITTLRNSVDQPKYPHISDVHSWLAEDSDLKLLWRNWSNFHRSVLSGLSAVRPPINHNNKPLHTSFLQSKPHACSESTFRADLLQIFMYKAKFGPSGKGIKTIDISGDQVLQKKAVFIFLTTKELRNFGRDENRTSFRKIGIRKSNFLRSVSRTNSNRMLKVILNYRPNMRRRIWRAWTRLLEKAEKILSRRK